MRTCAGSLYLNGVSLSALFLSACVAIQYAARTCWLKTCRPKLRLVRPNCKQRVIPFRGVDFSRIDAVHLL